MFLEPFLQLFFLNTFFAIIFKNLLTNSEISDIISMLAKRGGNFSVFRKVVILASKHTRTSSSAGRATDS